MTVVRVIRNDIAKIAAALQPRARAAAMKAALDTKRELTDRMSDAQSGRIYKRGAKIHQASAPGEAPAIDTGALANSIQVTPYGRTGAMIYTTMQYADVLEFGGVKVAPRPYMGPAIDKIAPKFLAAMAQLLKD